MQLRTGGRAGKEGKDIAFTFQVAKVTRPLWSVGRICDAGFDVKFTKDKATVSDPSGKAFYDFLRMAGLYAASCTSGTHCVKLEVL